MQEPNPELPQNPTPDLQAVTDAYRDILKHNRTHAGFGAIFKSILSGMMKNPDIIDVDNPEPTVLQSAEDVYERVGDELQRGVVEGDMNAELWYILYNDMFGRAGIKIAPFGQLGSNDEGKAVTSTELVPMIENTSLFSEFLNKLQPVDVQNKGAETFLSDVVANLYRVTGVCFDADKQKYLSPEERAQLAEAGEDALRTFVTIDPKYARLGIDGAAMRERVESISEELSEFLSSGQGGVVPAEVSDEYNQYRENQARMYTYEDMNKRVHYWGRNLLPEYIEAQSQQYLTPPTEQAFGPAKWQKDGGQHRWQEALGFLQILEEDRRTKPFAEEVRQGLIASLDYALAELEDTNKTIYWRDQGGDLANIRNALSGQQFDEAKLAAYIKKPDYLN